MATSGSPSITVLDIDRELQQDGGQHEQVHVISRRHKAAAAISSAAVTSLLMTPFDVIKTRMQTQAAPDPLFQPSSKSPPGVACCQSTYVVNEAGVLCRYDPRIETKVGTSTPRSSTSLRTPPHFGGGSGSSRPRMSPYSPHSANHMSGAACIYPDKSVATRELQQIQNNGRLSGLWDGVVKVGRTEGMRGLWRGLTPTLVMTVPSQLTYMTCYDIFRTFIMALRPPKTTSKTPALSNVSAHHMVASLVSGALARSASATLVTPIELIRTRLQASSSHNMTTTFANLSREVKQQGPRVLFRGLVPTLYRDVPFSALYFTGYESMKLVLTGAGFGERHVGNLRGKDFAVAFFSGATSGTLAAIVTQPFDLIKTRLQAAEDQIIRGAAAGTMTTVQLWRQIVAREGATGLFRGLSPRVAKVAPACGVMISTFELVARWLDERW